MKYQLALRDRTDSLGVLLPKQPRHFEQLTAFILQHLNRRISTRCVRAAEKSTSRERFLSANQTEPASGCSAQRVMDGVWAVLLLYVCALAMAGGCWRTHWERRRISRVYCTSESRHPLNETWQPASTPCAREALKHTERARSPFLIKLIRIQLNGGLILLQRLSRMHSESELSEWTRERWSMLSAQLRLLGGHLSQMGFSFVI